MSNWLTGIIVLFIIAILIDGFRRTYNLRRNSIHLSPKMKKRPKEPAFEEEAPPEILKSELPNGGARIIGYRNANEVQQPRKKVNAKDLREARRKEAAANRTPEQTRLNLNESVPILMESVSHQPVTAQNKSADHHERIDPTFSSEVVNDEEDYEHDQQDPKHHLDEDDTVYDEDDEDYDEDLDNEDGEGDFDEDDEDFDDDEALEEDWEEDKAASAAAPQPEPEEVIIINVMAFKGETFNGNDLLDVILKCGMRFGSMDIFHRYSDTKGEGTLLFSMANMVKPGTFDLDLMDEFETPGISLFMTLPIEADSMQSFELMVHVANTIADTLDGELKDEQRSAMTRQTIEHCRQRISDFERKKLFRRPR